ncbi:MAG: hypothetical protein ABGY95_00020 [Rubritalea sp.]|uniref:hypothetical protein n=1 Tax=Rubritalea sp. TaxID=2109375 RepID=UPI003242C00E
MSKDGKYIYLVKFAALGIPLYLGWNGNKLLGGEPTKNDTDFYPSLNAAYANKGELYRTMTARFSAGIQAL